MSNRALLEIDDSSFSVKRLGHKSLLTMKMRECSLLEFKPVTYLLTQELALHQKLSQESARKAHCHSAKLSLPSPSPSLVSCFF